MYDKGMTGVWGSGIVTKVKEKENMELVNSVRGEFLACCGTVHKK